jgi:hypothetical protein
MSCNTQVYILYSIISRSIILVFGQCWSSPAIFGDHVPATSTSTYCRVSVQRYVILCVCPFIGTGSPHPSSLGPKGGRSNLRVRRWGDPIPTTGQKAWYSVYSVVYTVPSGHRSVAQWLLWCGRSGITPSVQNYPSNGGAGGDGGRGGWIPHTCFSISSD